MKLKFCYVVIVIVQVEVQVLYGCPYAEDIEGELKAPQKLEIMRELYWTQNRVKEKCELGRFLYRPIDLRVMGLMQPGQFIELEGRFLVKSERIPKNPYMYLRIKEDESDDDRPIVMSFDLSKRTVTMNCVIDRKSQPKEYAKIPYSRGDPFIVRLRLLKEGFQIWCDNTMVHLFRHCFALADFKSALLRVEGDWILSNILYTGWHYDIPYSNTFASGSWKMYERMSMLGFATGNVWSLELLSDRGIVLFYFSPRFDKKHIVRFTYTPGHYKDEETYGPFPFKKWELFELVILNERYDLQIFVDNRHVATFPHSTLFPGDEYKKLKIYGDVELVHIEIY